MKNRLYGTVIIGLALVLSPANAQTQTQKNVMNHVSQALVVSNGCPALKPRILLMTLLLQNNRIDIDQSPFREFMQERGAHYTRAMAGHSTAIVCASGRLLYGAKGENVPNLLEE